VSEQRVRLLYLEERIGIARNSINHGAGKFKAALPEGLRDEFHQFVSDLMTVLDGDYFGEARKGRASKTETEKGK
jgi:hypothetical protein